MSSRVKRIAMEPGKLTSPEIASQDISRVMELETKRKENGYQLGWLFYQCKPLGLVEVMDYLRTEGLIESTSAHKEVKPKQILTIELVPETCWFSNVRSEVSDEDWDKLKQVTFDKAGRLCEICGGRGPKWPVECHEVWNYDDAKHIQTLLSLIALCPSCHEVKHRGLANVKGRGDIADLHLAKVNRWTMPKTKQYVEDQFQVWKKRSQYEWELDVSWLEQFGIQPKTQRRRTDVVSEGKVRNNVRVDKSYENLTLDDFINPDLF
jgi:hypothetical protein